MLQWFETFNKNNPANTEQGKRGTNCGTVRSAHANEAWWEEVRSKYQKQQRRASRLNPRRASRATNKFITAVQAATSAGIAKSASDGEGDATSSFEKRESFEQRGTFPRRGRSETTGSIEEDAELHPALAGCNLQIPRKRSSSADFGVAETYRGIMPSSSDEDPDEKEDSKASSVSSEHKKPRKSLRSQDLLAAVRKATMEIESDELNSEGSSSGFTSEAASEASASMQKKRCRRKKPKILRFPRCSTLERVQQAQAEEEGQAPADSTSTASPSSRPTEVAEHSEHSATADQKVEQPPSPRSRMRTHRRESQLESIHGCGEPPAAEKAEQPQSPQLRTERLHSQQSQLESLHSQQSQLEHVQSSGELPATEAPQALKEDQIAKANDPLPKEKFDETDGSSALQHRVETDSEAVVAGQSNGCHDQATDMSLSEEQRSCEVGPRRVSIMTAMTDEDASEEDASEDEECQPMHRRMTMMTDCTEEDDARSRRDTDFGLSDWQLTQLLRRYSNCSNSETAVRVRAMSMTSNAQSVSAADSDFGLADWQLEELAQKVWGRKLSVTSQDIDDDDVRSRRDSEFGLSDAQLQHLARAYSRRGSRRSRLSTTSSSRLSEIGGRLSATSNSGFPGLTENALRELSRTLEKQEGTQADSWEAGTGEAPATSRSHDTFDGGATGQQGGETSDVKEADGSEDFIGQTDRKRQSQTDLAKRRVSFRSFDSVDLEDLERQRSKQPESEEQEENEDAGIDAPIDGDSNARRGTELRRSLSPSLTSKRVSFRSFDSCVDPDEMSRSNTSRSLNPEDGDEDEEDAEEAEEHNEAVQDTQLPSVFERRDSDIRLSDAHASEVKDKIVLGREHSRSSTENEGSPRPSIASSDFGLSERQMSELQDLYREQDIEEVAEGMEKQTEEVPDGEVGGSCSAADAEGQRAASTLTEAQKRLRNVRKKLRELDPLQATIPEPNQPEIHTPSSSITALSKGIENVESSPSNAVSGEIGALATDERSQAFRTPSTEDPADNAELLNSAGDDEQDSHDRQERHDIVKKTIAEGVEEDSHAHSEVFSMSSPLIMRSPASEGGRQVRFPGIENVTQWFERVRSLTSGTDGGISVCDSDYGLSDRQLATLERLNAAREPESSPSVPRSVNSRETDASLLTNVSNSDLEIQDLQDLQEFIADFHSRCTSRGSDKGSQDEEDLHNFIAEMQPSCNSRPSDGGSICDPVDELQPAKLEFDEANDVEEQAKDEADESNGLSEAQEERRATEASNFHEELAEEDQTAETTLQEDAPQEPQHEEVTRTEEDSDASLAEWAKQLDASSIEEQAEEEEMETVEMKEQEHIENGPAEEVGVREVAVENEQADESGVGEAAAQDGSTEETRITDIAVQNGPAEEAGVRDAAVRDRPAEESGVRDVAVQNAPAEEVGVKEVAVQVNRDLSRDFSQSESVMDWTSQSEEDRQFSDALREDVPMASDYEAMAPFSLPALRPETYGITAPTRRAPQGSSAKNEATWSQDVEEVPLRSSEDEGSEEQDVHKLDAEAGCSHFAGSLFEDIDSPIFARATIQAFGDHPSNRPIYEGWDSSDGWCWLRSLDPSTCSMSKLHTSCSKVSRGDQDSRGQDSRGQASRDTKMSL